jgi:hypothetical protein
VWDAQRRTAAREGKGMGTSGDGNPGLAPAG